MSKYTDEEIEIILQANEVNNKMIEGLKNIVSTQDQVIQILKDYLKIPQDDKSV